MDEQRVIENNKEEVPFRHYCELFRGLDPAEAAARCGVPFENGEFRVRLLDTEYYLAWPEFAIRTADGQGLTLWDNVKYDAMRGIYDTDADTVKAAFSYDQDLITSTEDFFDYSWVYYDNDFMRFGALLSGENTGDPDIYNSWTITVNGEVENEKTWTLAELIETAPSITTPATMQCTINPTGGPLIANVKITGSNTFALFGQIVEE